MQFFSSLPLLYLHRRRRHHYRRRRLCWYGCVRHLATAHRHHRHTHFIPSAYAFNYNVSLPADYINIAPFVEVRCAMLHLPLTNYRGKV